MTDSTPQDIDPFDIESYSSRRVAVAMSGGVDSTVAAALLLDAGFDVTGITMRLMDTPASTAEHGTIDAAQTAARALGIPHVVIDLREKFERQVVEPFANEYLSGRTPNPCVACNRLIKWDALGEAAHALNCDMLATGHYVRIAEHPDGTRAVRCGIDSSKDQSYFLWRLDSALLSHTIFPLGGYTKSEIREKARLRNLSVADRTESQEICFIPGNDYRYFLEERFIDNPPYCMQPGPIIDTSGNILGTHSGTAFYTIGQRRGLGVAADSPRYVSALDTITNTVTLGTRDQLLASGLHAASLSWMRGFPPDKQFHCSIRIRYRHPGIACIVAIEQDTAIIRFDSPQSAVTPGQSAVLYSGDIVLGGGIITNAVQG